MPFDVFYLAAKKEKKSKFLHGLDTKACYIDVAPSAPSLTELLIHGCFKSTSFLSSCGTQQKPFSASKPHRREPCARNPLHHLTLSVQF